MYVATLIEQAKNFTWQHRFINLGKSMMTASIPYDYKTNDFCPQGRGIYKGLKSLLDYIPPVAFAFCLIFNM